MSSIISEFISFIGEHVDSIDFLKYENNTLIIKYDKDGKTIVRECYIPSK